MSTRRLLWIGCLSLSILGGAALATRATTGSTPASGLAAPGAESPQLRWKQGTAYHYELEWSTSLSAAVLGARDGDAPDPAAAARAGGRSRLAGMLIVRALGPRGGEALLEVSLAALREVDFQVGDQAAPADLARTSLEGHRAIVSVDERGTITAVHTAPDDPAMFRDVIRALLGDLGMRLGAPGETEWTALEHTVHGDVRSHYRRRGPGEIERTREAYETLHALRPAARAKLSPVVDGSATIRLDEQGALAAIEMRDSVVATRPGQSEPDLEIHAALSAVLSHTERFEPPVSVTLDGLERAAPGEPDDPRRASDQGLARDITPGAIDGLLVSHASGGPIPRGMVAKTAAYLRLHPEVCESLSTMIGRVATPPKARELAVDLLVAAGSPEAQRALRGALDSDGAKVDKAAYGMLVQRLVFLRSPDDASLAYVETLRDEAARSSDPGTARAATVALGGVAGKMLRGEEGSPAAEAIAEQLVAALGEGETGEDRAATVMAVGNLRRPDADAAALSALANDDDSQVRSAVAIALRGASEPEARGTLLDLLGDDDSGVAIAAAGSYMGGDLTGGDLAALTERLARNGTHTAADGSIAAALGHRLDDGPDVVRALEAILARAPEGSDLAAAVRGMLLAGQGGE